MKTQNSIHISQLRRFLFVIPVISSTAFAACSEVDRLPGTHPTVNLQSAAVGNPQSADNVVIGTRTYNAKDHGFDRPWPFGPEFNPQ